MKTTMSFRRRALGAGLLALLAAFIVPGTVYADHGHGNHGNSEHGNNGSQPSSPRAHPALYKAKLRAPAGPRGMNGELTLEQKVKRGAVSDLRLNVEANIVPASIATQTSELTLLITRAGAPVATCTLVLGEVDDDDDEGAVAAHYELHLRARDGGAVVSKNGFCDIDPSTVAVETGIPAVQSGDVVTVQDATPTTLLAGTIVKRK